MVWTLMVSSLSVETIVGVNKHRLDQEETIDVLVIDNTAVREEQIKRIEQTKANRDAHKVCVCDVACCSLFLSILDSFALTS